MEALSLDIWYVASPGGPLPSLLKLGSCGQKWPYPGVNGLQSFMYSENMKKSSCLKPNGPES